MDRVRLTNKIALSDDRKKAIGAFLKKYVKTHKEYFKGSIKGEVLIKDLEQALANETGSEKNILKLYIEALKKDKGFADGIAKEIATEPHAYTLKLEEPARDSDTDKFIEILKSYAYHPKTDEKSQHMEQPLIMRRSVWYSFPELKSIFKSLRGRAEQYIEVQRAKINGNKDLKDKEKKIQVREMVDKHVSNLSTARNLIPGMIKEFSSRLNKVPEADRAEFLKNNPRYTTVAHPDDIKEWQDIVIKTDEVDRMERLYDKLEEEALNPKKKKDEGDEEQPEKKEKFDLERTQTKQKGVSNKGWGMVEFTKWEALKRLVETLKHDADNIALKITDDLYPMPNEEGKLKAAMDVFAGDNVQIKDVKNVDLEESYFQWHQENMDRMTKNIKETHAMLSKLKTELNSDVPEPESTGDVDMKDEYDKLKELKKTLPKDEYLKEVKKVLDKEVAQKMADLEALEKAVDEMTKIKKEMDVEKGKVKEIPAGLSDPEHMALVVLHTLESFKRYHSMLWSVAWVHNKFEIVSVEDIHRNLTRVKSAAEGPEVPGTPEPAKLTMTYDALITSRKAALAARDDLQDMTDHVAGAPIMSKAVYQYASKAVKAAEKCNNVAQKFFQNIERYYASIKKPVPGRTPLKSLKTAEEPKLSDFERIFKLNKVVSQIDTMVNKFDLDKVTRSEAVDSLDAFYSGLKDDYLKPSKADIEEAQKEKKTPQKVLEEKIPDLVEGFLNTWYEKLKRLAPKSKERAKERFNDAFHKDKIQDAVDNTVATLNVGPEGKDTAQKKFDRFCDEMEKEFLDIPSHDLEEKWVEKDLPIKIKHFLDGLKKNLFEGSPLKDVPVTRSLDKVFDKAGLEEELNHKLKEHRGDPEQIDALKESFKGDIEEVFNFLKKELVNPTKSLEEEAKKKGITHQKYIEDLVPGLKGVLKASWEPEKVEEGSKEFKTKYTALDDFIKGHSTTTKGPGWFPNFDEADDKVSQAGIGHALIREVKEKPIGISDMEKSPVAFFKKHFKGRGHPLIHQTIEKIQNNATLHGGGGGSGGGREKILKHIVSGMAEITEANLARYLKGEQSPESFISGHGGLLYNIARNLKNETRMSGQLYKGDVIDAIVGILKTITFNLKKIQIDYPGKGKSNRGEVFTPHDIEKKVGPTTTTPSEEKFEVTKKGATPKGWGGFKFHKDTPGTESEKAKSKIKEVLFKDVPFKSQESGSHVSLNSLKDAEYFEDRIKGLIDEINKVIAPDKIETSSKNTIYPNGLLDALAYFRPEKTLKNPKELEEKRKEDEKMLKLKPRTFQAPFQKEDRRFSTNLMTYMVASNFLTETSSVGEDVEPPEDLSMIMS